MVPAVCLLAGERLHDDKASPKGVPRLTANPASPLPAKVIPGSDLLRVAQADLEERRGRIEEADSLWKAFLKDRRSTTGHVMYLRLVSSLSNSSTVLLLDC